MGLCRDYIGDKGKENGNNYSISRKANSLQHDECESSGGAHLLERASGAVRSDPRLQRCVHTY